MKLIQLLLSSNSLTPKFTICNRKVKARFVYALLIIIAILFLLFTDKPDCLFTSPYMKAAFCKGVR